jgi:hypothetical protein
MRTVTNSTDKIRRQTNCSILDYEARKAVTLIHVQLAVMPNEYLGELKIEITTSVFGRKVST